MPYQIKCASCGKIAILKRKGRFCSVKCKTAAYEREHPRQKIGALTHISINDKRYRLVPEKEG